MIKEYFYMNKFKLLCDLLNMKLKLIRNKETNTPQYDLLCEIINKITDGDYDE